MKKLFSAFVFALTGIVSAFSAEVINVVTDNTQLVMRVKDDGRLYQTYLGERLSPVVELSALDMPRTNVTSSVFRGNEVYPVIGTEDFYDAPFEIRHADGNCSSVLKYVSHRQQPIKGGVETIVTLKDEVYPVTVVLHYLAYERENVISQYLSGTAQ